MKKSPISKHQKDYKPEAWKGYTLNELGNWVHNLAKRAAHRDNRKKMKKDLIDARNYLWIMERKLKTEVEGLGFDWDSLSE